MNNAIINPLAAAGERIGEPPIHQTPVDFAVHFEFGFTKLLRLIADIFFAKHDWKLPADRTLRDVVLRVRADEVHHRDINHGFANELDCTSASSLNVAPYPPHADEIRLEP